MMSHVSKKTRPTSKSRKQVPLNCKIAGDANTTVHWFVCLDGKCKQIDRPKSKSGQTECRQLYEAARAMAPNQKPYGSIRPSEVFKLYVDTNSHSRTNYMLEYHPSNNIKKIATAVGLAGLGAGATWAYRKMNARHQHAYPDKLYVTGYDYNSSFTKDYQFQIQSRPGKFFSSPVYYSSTARMSNNQDCAKPTLLMTRDDWYRLQESPEIPKNCFETSFRVLEVDKVRDAQKNHTSAYVAVWNFPHELYKFEEFNLITDSVQVKSIELPQTPTEISLPRNIQMRRDFTREENVCYLVDDNRLVKPLLPVSYFVSNLDNITNNEKVYINQFIKNFQDQTDDMATYFEENQFILFRSSDWSVSNYERKFAQELKNTPAYELAILHNWPENIKIKLKTWIKNYMSMFAPEDLNVRRPLVDFASEDKTPIT